MEWAKGEHRQNSATDFGTIDGLWLIPCQADHLMVLPVLANYLKMLTIMSSRMTSIIGLPQGTISEESEVTQDSGKAMPADYIAGS